jgi:hypothetical protein
MQMLLNFCEEKSPSYIVLMTENKISCSALICDVYLTEYYKDFKDNNNLFFNMLNGINEQQHKQQTLMLYGTHAVCKIRCSVRMAK